MADVLSAYGLCREVVTQDDVAKGRQLDRLNSEQLALLDMLIAMQAQVVGGSYWSLTTLLVRELRYARLFVCVAGTLGTLVATLCHHTGTCGRACLGRRWCASMSQGRTCTARNSCFTVACSTNLTCTTSST